MKHPRAHTFCMDHVVVDLPLQAAGPCYSGAGVRDYGILPILFVSQCMVL